MTAARDGLDVSWIVFRAAVALAVAATFALPFRAAHKAGISGLRDTAAVAGISVVCLFLALLVSSLLGLQGAP